GCGCDLVDGLALHAQADQKAANLCRGTFAGHDGAHDGRHLFLAQILPLGDAADRCLDVHCLSPQAAWRRRRRKLASSSWPASDRMDSGWNCTPSTSSERCRTPMISSMPPSGCSLQAVTSRQSGKLALSITSEW